MKNTTYLLHTLTQQDIPPLIALSDSVGWDYDEAELRTVLSAGSMFGHKDEDGQLVSCSAIICYEDQLASIGMVIVHDSCRGYGLGRELMQACLSFVSKETTIMLVSTPAGKPLYESLGFTTAEPLHKCLRDHFSPPTIPSMNADDPVILPMQLEDVAAIIELDGQAIGSKRSLFVQARMKQAASCLVAKDAAGKTVGYGFSIQGPVNLIIGPLVAPDFATAIRIFCRLTQGHTGKLRVDVPNGQAAFLDFLEQNGFTKVSEPPVMIANANQLPQRNGTYYGIAAQIFG
ncbi:N-acetyltransferase [Brevibacillus reuszeri]|uniref:Acetyltransferase n=1 Tax=Brevibacillus reuszeri TaxID=54915 RepID=A0A0K9Z0Q8_9BACL|nr:GNAT family N-acetyltransferase [Brevibacillus reuszeri]KNB74050.1 acetyltransferase [Brevibacillus reuszeri]MED1859774.1 GNAT family N-acetyltransferase [Brevibacillus reuszeri]GED72434.1 N-acetyltransferase [Brevibacillus reuszeri]